MNIPSIQAGVGALPKNQKGTLANITDGQTSTIMYLESAGRPFLYRRGPVLVNSDLRLVRVNGGGWTRPASDILFAGSNRLGTVIPAPNLADSAVAATNGDDVASVTYPHPYYGTEGTSQPFAFHGTGFHATFADASVHFLDEGISIEVLAALITRDKAERVSDASY